MRQIGAKEKVLSPALWSVELCVLKFCVHHRIDEGRNRVK